MAQNSDSFAALDLGSNSFHMIVARQTPAGIAITDRLRAPVRLAAGITNAGGITQDAQDRALQCLERFGQRLRELPSKHVRAVGTNALRQAKRATSFLRDAQDALGHRIDIIPGIEEGVAGMTQGGRSIDRSIDRSTDRSIDRSIDRSVFTAKKAAQTCCASSCFTLPYPT